MSFIVGGEKPKDVAAVKEQNNEKASEPKRGKKPKR